MNRLNGSVIVSFLLVIGIWSPSAFAEGEIQTMWVFDETTFNRLSFAQRVAYPVARIADANVALSSTGLSNRFDSFPFIQPLQAAPITSTTNTSTADLMEFLRDDPWALMQRGDGDILMMVVSDVKATEDLNGTSVDVCGTAWQPPRILGANRSESHAFAVVVDNNTCDDNEDLNTPHELGHVIGAEHEVQLDDNDDTFLPDPFNHAYKGFAANGSSIMVSSPQAVMLPGFSSGQSTWANVKDFFTRDINGTSKTPWGLVADYRPLPPPPPCVITVAQVCENNSPRAIVTPTVAGFTMTNIDMEYRLSGSSNWYPIYDGAPTCPIYNPPSSFLNSVVSALVTTAAGHITGCEVNVIPIWCGNGDPL